MSDMVPPPRSSLGWASRCHACARLGRELAQRAGEVVLDLLERRADAIAQALEPGARASSLRRSTVAASGSGVGVLVGERIESRGLAQGLAHYHGCRQRDIERACALLQRNAQLTSAASCTSSGTPALSRPNSRVSSVAKATPGNPSPPWSSAGPAGPPDVQAPGQGALESGPRGMAGDARQVVVHGGAADAVLVVDREAARLDDVERYLQTGRKTDEGPEILGNVSSNRARRMAFVLLASASRKAPATGRAARCRRTPANGPATNRALKHKALFAV